MNTFKRITSVLLALTLFAACAFSVSAAAPESLIDATKKCSITVTKYVSDTHVSSRKESTVGAKLNADDIDPAAKPLAGIVFTATKLDADGEKTGTVKTFPATDKNGVAKLTGLTQGKWYVEETPNTAIAASSALPVTVTLPFTSDDGTKWLYDAYVYPKNGDLTIVKDIQHLGNDHHTADIAENHTWIVTTDIPEDIAPYSVQYSDGKTENNGGYKSYSVVDTLDTRLKYISTAKVVAVANSTTETTVGDEVKLTENTDYTVSVSGQIVTYSLTDAGRAKVSPLNGKTQPNGHAYTSSQALVSGGSTTKLRIYLVTQIRNTITQDDLAKEIKNKATLKFTNSFGSDGERVSDEPEVHTTGIKIYKFDEETQQPLAGAKFKIATSEENAENGVFIQRDGKDYEVTTDEQGEALFIGLAYGTRASKYNDSSVKGSEVTDGETIYYLVETEAPVNDRGDSYQLIGGAIAAAANSTSFLKANALSIANTPPVYVMTGGIGDFPFALTGIILIGIAAVGLTFAVSRRRKEK